MPKNSLNRKVKILFILESFYPNTGGVEKLFKQLAGKLLEYGWEVTVLTSKPYSKALPKASQIKYKYVPFRSRYLFTLTAFFYGLWVAPGKDIIHTTSYNAALPAFLLSKIFRIKSIITFHEYWGKLWFELPYISKFKAIFFFNFEKFISKLKFEKVVAVSNYTHKTLKQIGINPKNLVRIYNGIEYSPHSPFVSHSKVYTFLFVGRAGISKGLNLIVKAAEIIKYEKFKIIIQSPDSRQNFVLNKVKAELEKIGQIRNFEICTLKLSENKLKKLYMNVDCLLVPSYSEGFCFSAAEASALGVPIVDSGRGALKEVVSGKYLVFDNMSPKALASAMQLAMKGKFLYKPLKKFELSDTVEAYIQLYASLLNSAK